MIADGPGVRFGLFVIVERIRRFILGFFSSRGLVTPSPSYWVSSAGPEAFTFMLLDLFLSLSLAYWVLLAHFFVTTTTYICMR